MRLYDIQKAGQRLWMEPTPYVHWVLQVIYGLAVGMMQIVLVPLLGAANYFICPSYNPDLPISLFQVASLLYLVFSVLILAEPIQWWYWRYLDYRRDNL